MSEPTVLCGNCGTEIEVPQTRTRVRNILCGISHSFLQKRCRKQIFWVSAYLWSAIPLSTDPGAPVIAEARGGSLRPKNARPKAAWRSFLPSRRTPHGGLFFGLRWQSEAATPLSWACDVLPSKRRGGRSSLPAALHTAVSSLERGGRRRPEAIFVSRISRPRKPARMFRRGWRLGRTRADWR